VALPGVNRDLCHCRWLPESARWLLANGEKEKAHFYLEKCAKMNNRSKCMAEITPQVHLMLTYVVSC
jgi:C4-dicarboxylate-specific signal transduction histidine kinase